MPCRICPGSMGARDRQSKCGLAARNQTWFLGCAATVSQYKRLQVGRNEARKRDRAQRKPQWPSPKRLTCGKATECGRMEGDDSRFIGTSGL